MAVAILHSTSRLRLTAASTLVLGWLGIGGVVIPSEINTPLHSHNLPCYRHVSRSAFAKATVGDQVIYLSVLGT